MSQTSWIPLVPPGIEPHHRPPVLTDDEFRVVIKVGIQKIFMWVCFEEIRSVTGPGSLKATLEKIGIDVHTDSELQAWRARLKGERFPRNSVIKQLRRQVPQMRLNLSHPMIRWLASPQLDERSIRRLQAQMPPVWHDVVAKIKTLPVNSLKVSPKLFKVLGLERADYLDALFAFARARSSATCDDERRRSINRAMWALPILYPDDPIWTAGTHEDRYNVMTAIDYVLGLHGPNDPGVEWLATRDRVQYISHQHWSIKQWVTKHPHSMRTAVLRRRYWAWIWQWHEK